jgi:hypothetical protein
MTVLVHEATLNDLRKTRPDFSEWGFPLLLIASALLAWRLVSRDRDTVPIAFSVLGFGASGLICTLLGTRQQTASPSEVPVTRVLAIARVLHQLAIALLVGLIVACVALCLLGGKQPALLPIHGWSLGISVVASLAALRDRQTCFPLAALYLLGLVAIGTELLFRDLTSARFLVWAAICEVTGFLLVAALVGWATTQVPFLQRWQRVSSTRAVRCRRRFLIAQAALYAVATAIAVDIALDRRFDGLGEGIALLGLHGRSASCPAALMLLGAAIAMVWQTAGRHRAAWQYVALFAGLLFTTSIGWSTTDVSGTTGHASAHWLSYCESLLVTASMMTFVTGFGLPRFLPRHSDWSSRARQAMPAFACLAGLMLVILLASLAWPRLFNDVGRVPERDRSKTGRQVSVRGMANHAATVLCDNR